MKEGDSREPTMIRGHHLKEIHSLNMFSPEELADKITDNRKKEWDKVSNRKKRRVVEATTYKQSDATYPHDVIGATDEEAETFRAKAVDVFTTWTELDDDAPVKLVDGQKDDLCKACTHGNHCGIKTPNINSDQVYIQSFVLIANAKRGFNSFSEGLEKDQYTNTKEPVEKPTVTTTAGVLRDVMSGPEVFEMLKHVQERVRHQPRRKLR